MRGVKKLEDAVGQHRPHLTVLGIVVHSVSSNIISSILLIDKLF
jgi:hypothetical protein